MAWCMIKRHIRLKIIKNWKELNIEDGMFMITRDSNMKKQGKGSYAKPIRVFPREVLKVESLIHLNSDYTPYYILKS